MGDVVTLRPHAPPRKHTGTIRLIANGRERPNDCKVCQGVGTYPVFDSSGFNLYDIRCPHCGGTGNA